MLKRLSPIFVLAAFGCDQLSSKTQGVAVLTRTPDLANASDLSSDLAAVLPIDDIANNGATAVAFALGERDSVTSTNITEISSASVTVTWSGVSVGLCAQASAAGTYSATSVSNATCGEPRLAYAAGAAYTFDAETTGDQYTIRITAPGTLDSDDVVFDPALTALTETYGAQLRHHTRSEPLRVDWSRAGVSEPAFVTVFRIDYRGNGNNDALNATSWLASPDNPVYENAPRSASDYINLVLDDSPATTLTIPRETFDTQGVYIAVVTPVAVGTDVSSNLSLGSGAVAGAGTAFAFWVQ